MVRFIEILNEANRAKKKSPARCEAIKEGGRRREGLFSWVLVTLVLPEVAPILL